MAEAEKKAMSGDDRMKYVKATLAAAIAAAGVGAVAKNIKSKRNAAEANDTAASKNAIVVPVLKKNFMEGLPTPEELAKSRGEGVKPTGVATSAAQPASQAQAAQLSQDDIAAKKKEILGNGRRVDFFGKRASAKKAEDSDGQKASGKGGEDSPKKDKGENKEERLVFRDQEGKFVSPTNPVSVASVSSVEKKSADGKGGYNWTDGIWNTVFHPIDSMGVMWDAAKDKPVAVTAGAVGSIILAAKISESVNKIRRERSKERLNKARDRYVELLEGNENGNQKAAQDGGADPRVTAGALIGGSFLVPMALTALVTNRIIENRKRDKKLEKEMSDSYPDDPIILYKTSEGKDVGISPETAVTLFSVKYAMLKAAEDIEGMEKSAQFGWTMRGFTDSLGNFAGKASDMLGSVKDTVPMLGLAGEFKDGKLTDKGYEMLAGDKYDEPMFNLINGWANGKPNAAGIIPGAAGVMKNIARDPRTLDLLVNKFSNKDAPKYNERWGKLQNQVIDRELSRTFTDKGLGGAFKNMLSWFMKNTGLGGWFFRKGLAQKLGTLPAQTGQGNTQQTTATQPTT